MTDAHNHLQQFTQPAKILTQASAAGVARMLVNGTCEEDWPQVALLAKQHPDSVLPSFGLHPWQVPTRCPDWLSSLRQHLLAHPTAAVGECGLDRWKRPFDLPVQLDCLQSQLDLASELQRPVTIHCLRAWGPLLELLQEQSTLQPFLLHAYSGSTEMMSAFAELGAYFSFNGYFLHERKGSVRATFRKVPPDRLLIESDAPAMLPPPEFQSHPLSEERNHPANLSLSLPALARLRSLEPSLLCQQMEANLQAFYSPCHQLPSL